jgi:phosphohistidine phosphatase
VKRLYLLRHGKSSWDDASLPDHERPLAPRGRRAAKLMGDHLSREDIHPAFVLCSSSVRTRETLSRIGKALGDEPPVQFEEELYGAGAEQLLERLRQLPADLSSVLLIGHNPGMHELALDLADSGVQLARLEEKFPTAALATLEFELETWADLEPGSGELVGYVVPRELG